MIKDLFSKYSHLVSASLTILLIFGILFGGTIYAQSLERADIHALAPLMLSQSFLGSALQQAGFQQSDLLEVYGSSEMLVEDTTFTFKTGTSNIVIGSTPYGASQFFQHYPTGFDVYEIVGSGVTSLSIAQDLAAVGADLRGKKLVVSFAPSVFKAGQVHPAPYAGNFSILHANALIFNSHLSLETKTIAARRMSEYPNTLSKDLILEFAIRQLNRGRWYGRYLYLLMEPLGQLDIWVIRLQDHWAVVNFIWNHPELSTQIVRKPEQINWQEETAQALATQKTYTTNNSYGVENDIWDAYYAKTLTPPNKPGAGDDEFIKKINASKEWLDFDLMLRILKELGAQPLILIRPLNGPIFDASGVSKQARQKYYVKLQNAVAAYDFPLADFDNHDGDRYFSMDGTSHSSREGWVYIDQTLDSFFHERIH